MKQFTFSSLLILSVIFLNAQDKTKIFTRNSAAYEVKEVKYNSKQNDYCAVKFFDAVVFTSSRSRGNKKPNPRANEKDVHVYTTEKTSSGKDLKPKIFLHDLKTPYVDGPVSFNKDYTMIYFSRDHIKNSSKGSDGKFKYKLFESHLNRNGLDSVIKFPFSGNDYNVMHPSISSDGSMIFFTSDMPGGKGGTDIYFSRKSAGVWGAPVNLGEKVNSSANESFPFIMGNDLLYFASDRPDGMGGLDIYESKIKDDKGKKAYNMGEPINSKFDDFGYYVKNGSGFISSNRKSEGKDDDIYELDVLKEVKRGKDILILAKDKNTGSPLANTKITINDDVFSANEKGEYTLMAEDGVNYKIQATKDDYFDSQETVSTESSPEDEFTKELLFEKDPKVVLTAVITDAQNGRPLEGVTIKVKDMISNSDFKSVTTTVNGVYHKPLMGKRIGDKLIYTITLEKPGYLEKTVSLNSEVTGPGDINLNDKINLSIGKVIVGTDLAKLIEIKPIYFDLGKPTIRPDAAVELDKVVAIMNEYPNMSIELGSHTDCRSAANLNLKLSAARAKASVDYIVKKGISALRITGKGYGETKLLNNCACEGKVTSNCSEEEHTKNRRTEFVVTKMQ